MTKRNHIALPHGAQGTGRSQASQNWIAVFCVAVVFCIVNFSTLLCLLGHCATAEAGTYAGFHPHRVACAQAAGEESHVPSIAEKAEAPESRSANSHKNCPPKKKPPAEMNERPLKDLKELKDSPGSGAVLEICFANSGVMAPVLPSGAAALPSSSPGAVLVCIRQQQHDSSNWFDLPS
jgi:hypothetical protein